MPSTPCRTTSRVRSPTPRRSQSADHRRRRLSSASSLSASPTASQKACTSSCVSRAKGRVRCGSARASSSPTKLPPVGASNARRRPSRPSEGGFWFSSSRSKSCRGSGNRCDGGRDRRFRRRSPQNKALRRMPMVALASKLVNTTAIPRPGNGNGSVNGRGLKHLKASQQERVGLAADVVTGEKHVDLSYGQLCSVFDVPPVALRNELKRRAAVGNGNGGAENLTAMAAELVSQLGLDGAFDLLVEVTER